MLTGQTKILVALTVSAFCTASWYSLSAKLWVQGLLLPTRSWGSLHEEEIK